MTDKTPEAAEAEETFAEAVTEQETETEDEAQSLEELAEADDGPQSENTGQDADDAGDADDVDANAADDSDAETDADAPKMVSYVDDDGKEWEVPEALTPALMKNRDYTTKTQALADERKAIEAQRAALEAEKQRTQEDLRIDGELARLSAHAAEYEKINWDELFQIDRDEATHKQFQYGRVREDIARLEGLRQSRSEARLQEAQSAMTKRFNEAEEYAKANIPGWSQGKDAELLDFAREVGFDDQSLQANISPAFLKMLYRASLGEQALNRAKTQTKKQAKEVKPAAKIKAKSSPTNRIDYANADMESFKAAMEKGADFRLSDL